MFCRGIGDTTERKGEGGVSPVAEDFAGRRQRLDHIAGFLSAKQRTDAQEARNQKPDSHSDEVDSRSGDGGAAGSEQIREEKKRTMMVSFAGTAAGGGEGGIAAGAAAVKAKRPRGRPPGSKNKPKTPVVVAGGVEGLSSAAMRPHVLEVSAGQDVVDALAGFSRRRNLGLCVLSGTGLVSNVVLRRPPASQTSPPRSPDLTFPGRFEILSISATFFPPSFAPFSPLALPDGGGGFSVSLAGPHGQVFGGVVSGPLTAAGTVTILAAAFDNPMYHRLPADDDDEDVSVSVSVSAEAPRPPAPGHQRQQHGTVARRPQNQRHQPREQQGRQPCSSSSLPASSSFPAGASPQQHRPAAPLALSPAVEVSGLSIYRRHLPSDVMIWAPAADPPPYD